MCAPVYQTESGTFSPPHCHLLPFTRGQGHLLLSNLPQGRHSGAVVSAMIVRLHARAFIFSLSLCELSPSTSTSPTAQWHAREVNWQFQTISWSDCECEWSFVFLWPEWQFVLGVVPSSHPRAAGIGRPLPASMQEKWFTYIQLVHFYMFVYFSCTNH